MIYQSRVFKKKVEAPPAQTQSLLDAKRVDRVDGAQWGEWDEQPPAVAELTPADIRELRIQHGSIAPNRDRAARVKYLMEKGHKLDHIARLLNVGRRQCAKDHAALLRAGVVKPSKPGATK